MLCPYKPRPYGDAVSVTFFLYPAPFYTPPCGEGLGRDHFLELPPLRSPLFRKEGQFFPRVFAHSKQNVGAGFSRPITAE